MLSFVHPVFLVALAGLAVPVVLHLMNREIPVSRRFSSIRFILRGQLPREGRRRLQDVLVLLIRLLLCVAAVLAFARPIWHPRRPDGAATAASRTDVVFLVDVSASMQGWDGLRTARERVLARLQELESAAVGLVLSAAGPTRVLSVGSSQAEVRDALLALAAEPVRGDPLPALKQAARLFRPDRTKQLVVVSDFQRTDWQLLDSAGLAPDVHLELIDVNPGRTGNAGVTGVSVRAVSPDVRQVVAEVRNFGLEPVQRALQLRAGEEHYSRTVAIEPLRAKRIAFTVKPAIATRGELLLDADAYPADDTYLFWLGKPEPTRLLAVVPLTAEPEKQAELFFVKKAIGVTAAGGAEYALDVVDAEHFFSLSLGGVQGLLLLGAAGYFGDPEFGLLHDFLDRGGVVICTPGVTPAQQFSGLQRSGLLAAECLGVAGQHTRTDEPFALSWVDPDSPLGQLFAAAESSELLLFPIFRYARLRAGPQAHVLLRIGEKDAALLEQETGSGHLFALALALDTRWSDLPTTTAFLPLLRELLSFAAPVDGGIRRLECGQDLPRTKDLLGAEVPVTPAELAAADTRKPAVFVLAGTPCEVNVSRRESVVEKVNLEDLRHVLQPEAAATTPVAASLDLAEADARTQVLLWPHCAAAAAVLLLLELLVATLLDRRQSVGVSPGGTGTAGT